VAVSAVIHEQVHRQRTVWIAWPTPVARPSLPTGKLSSPAQQCGCVGTLAVRGDGQLLYLPGASGALQDR
jgi:hypothetical protein